MKRIKLLVLIAALALGSFALMACETETPAADDTRTIVDQAGRTVTIPKEVDRIVTTWRPSSTLVFAIQAQEKLVAIDTHSYARPYFNAIYPEVAKLDKTGNKKGLNIETIIANNPQVVFIWKGSDSLPHIEQLEKNNIAVVVLDPESREDMIASTRLMAEVVGKEKEAEAIIAYFNDMAKQINDKLVAAGITDANKKKVVMAQSNLLNIMPGEIFQNDLIEMAGGINAAKDIKGTRTTDISAEELVNLNPEYIIYNQFFEGNDIHEDVASFPGVQNIQAIKDGNVYQMPSALESWDFPAPSAVLGVMWLADTLYPEVFADFDFEAKYEEFHKTFYGKSYSELLKAAEGLTK